MIIDTDFDGFSRVYLVKSVMEKTDKYSDEELEILHNAHKLKEKKNDYMSKIIDIDNQINDLLYNVRRIEFTGKYVKFNGNEYMYVTNVKQSFHSEIILCGKKISFNISHDGKQCVNFDEDGEKFVGRYSLNDEVFFITKEEFDEKLEKARDLIK